MFIKILLLIGLTRLLSMTNNPLLCSGIYTGIGVLFMGFSGHMTLMGVIIGGAMAFALSSIYFLLLHRFSENLPVYFVVLGGGLIIGLV